MADLDEKGKKKEDEGEPKKGEGEGTGADPKNTDSNEGDAIAPVPYDRFKEVNERAKTAEARIAELEKADADRQGEDEKARAAKLKEQEKFEQLATEWETKFNDASPKLASAEKELEELRTLLAAQAEAQMAKIPDLYREVVQALPLQQRLTWLTENSEKLTEAKPGGIPKTPKGEGQGELSPEDRRKLTQRTF